MSEKEEQEIKKLKKKLKVQEKKNIEIRDQLALQRTIFANERTLMAYLRTALTFLVAGLSFIKFFDTKAFDIAGGVLIPIGLLVCGYGVFRYFEKSKHITLHQEEYAETSHMHAHIHEKEASRYGNID
ncbi:DUF202 domain-containing protein [Rufibacter radiotolerans]|uniref:DUF202 domain-containing protein n=1 Tax=Rufibacter radiotolerans TaxID=1379910 RepID=UPI00066453BE|nr:DUF202 domain-containing protein [Rufibacter radiotolerans]